MNKEKIKNILLIIRLTLSLLIPEFGTRLLLYKDIDFMPLFHLPSILFTISYILIILLIYYIKPKLGKIIYITLTIIFIIYSFAQMLHFQILDRILTITDILVADQGATMIGYIIRQIHFSHILIVLLSIIFLIISIKLINKNNNKPIQKQMKLKL